MDSCSQRLTAATLLPGPPTSRYGPPTSLNKPIRIGAETVCARITAGLASGAAANVPIIARRVILFIVIS